MKKIFFLILVIFISCNRKMEFIQSETIPSLILVRNSIENDSLLKNQLISFIIKNHHKNRIQFYKYTWNTSYFLDNKEDIDGGFSDNALYDYPEDNIADYFVLKCEEDTTKLVGRFHFYGNAGLKGKKREIDTLIYHCKQITEFILQERKEAKNRSYLREYIENYRSTDGIAMFSTNRCEKDSTKLYGDLHFYLIGNFYKPDAIFNNCN